MLGIVGCCWGLEVGWGKEYRREREGRLLVAREKSSRTMPLYSSCVGLVLGCGVGLRCM